MQRLILGAALALMGGTAQAATVADSLPYQGTPDWTDIIFDSTSMTTNGTSSKFTTLEGRGVWFGWGSSYGDQPAWTPASSADGVYFGLEASFSSYAADWSAYYLDGTHEAAFQFVPTDCDANQRSCYGDIPAAGVTMYFGAAGGGATAQFVALDMTQRHSFEFLLKSGQVAYRVDGQVYSGVAYGVDYYSKLLVVGDGSGGSPSGLGSMTVYSANFVNAPEFALAPVPEPGEWAMIAGGLTVVGAVARRRKKN